MHAHKQRNKSFDDPLILKIETMDKRKSRVQLSSQSFFIIGGFNIIYQMNHKINTI